MRQDLEEFLFNEILIWKIWVDSNRHLFYLAPECAGRRAINIMLERGMIQSYKQGWRTLEKWDRKGFWDYGVSLH